MKSGWGGVLGLGEEKDGKYVIIVHSAFTLESIQYDESSGNPI